MSKLTKIQRFARGKACQLRIPGVHRETPEHEDTCLCHAPHPNRGGMRKDDHWGAVGCEACHASMDGRDTRLFEFLGSYGTLMGYWLPAIFEWQSMLIEAGLMTVNGIEPVQKMLPRR